MAPAGSPLALKGMPALSRRPRSNMRRGTTACPTVSWLLSQCGSIGTSRLYAGREAPNSSPARSTPCRRQSRCHRPKNRFHSHIMTVRMTALFSTMFRRPCPPDGTPQEFIGGLPIGRVVSACPASSSCRLGRADGWVCSQRFDHTSVPHPFTWSASPACHAEPNISDWRRKSFGDADVGVPLRPTGRQTACAARYRRHVASRQLCRRQPARACHPGRGPASTGPGTGHAQAGDIRSGRFTPSRAEAGLAAE